MSVTIVVKRFVYMRRLLINAGKYTPSFVGNIVKLWIREAHGSPPFAKGGLPIVYPLEKGCQNLHHLLLSWCLWGVVVNADLKTDSALRLWSNKEVY